MEGGQRRPEAHDDGIVKIELKQLPLYVAYVIVFLQFANPTLVTDLVNTYFTNMVYIIMIVGGFAYIQGLQYFRELFNIHKNDAPHEHQQPEGTEMMNLFDGHIRVVLLMQKQTVIREVHREVLLLGNGLVQVNDEEQRRERRQGRRKKRKQKRNRHAKYTQSIGYTCTFTFDRICCGTRCTSLVILVIEIRVRNKKSRKNIMESYGDVVI